MTIHHTYAGIDISRDHLDIFEPWARRHRRLANTPEAIAGLLKGWRGRGVCVVFEATGAYGLALRRGLAEAGIAGCQVNPMRARRFAQSRGRLAKTDRIDAAGLAWMGERFRLEPTAPFCEKTEALKALVTRRDQLVQTRAGERKRLKQCHATKARASIERTIGFLDEEIAGIEKGIKTALKDRAFADPARRLRTIPGLADKTMPVLIAWLPELGTLTPKTAAALAGLAPFAADSGRMSRARHIQGGRERLRRALYMAAVGTLNGSSRLRRFYDRLVDAGKPKKLALIAVARKILTIANAIVRDKTEYA